VPDNVILQGDRAVLIDLDDCGWGWRLFDLATTLNRLDREQDSARLTAAFLQAYQDVRPIDLTHLTLFRALRAWTYLGWIVPRMTEAGGEARLARFTAAARHHANLLLELP
jgi:Ser/Thr protein kinase RdoA (MazF antagonist)